MSKSNLTKVGTAKTRVPASEKRKTSGRTAKLKSSKWYQGTFQSVGIIKGSLLETRGDVSE